MPPSYPAGSYPAAVVADGAVAYWRLAETSGTTAVDVIGAANGTISGGVTLGQAGALADGDKAMAFDGTSGYISVPHSAAITPTGPFTVETWLKTTAIDERPIIAKFNGGGYIFSIASGLSYVYLGAGWIAGNVTLNNGQWHHLVFVWTGSLFKSYLDGIEDKSTATTVTLGGTHALEIGRRYDNANYLAGSLDEVAYYPTALTAPQIAAHYAAKTWTAPTLPDIRWRWCRYVPNRARR